MGSRKRASAARLRVGRVSLYFHHGAWWLYHRDQGRQVRRKIAATRQEAEQIAAEVNAQLASGAPTLLAFTPIGVADLRQEFLSYHEHVLKSALATVRRYRAATHHLHSFALAQARTMKGPSMNPLTDDLGLLPMTRRRLLATTDHSVRRHKNCMGPPMTCRGRPKGLNPLKNASVYQTLS